MDGGYGTDSGPSRGDPCRRAFRPTEASKAAVCYVRNTSIPDTLDRWRRMFLGLIEPMGGSGLGRDSANLVANAEHGNEHRFFVQMIANIYRQVLWLAQYDGHAKLGIHVSNAICPCIAGVRPAH